MSFYSVNGTQNLENMLFYMKVDEYDWEHIDKEGPELCAQQF